MDINKIIELQKNFDSQHKGKFHWDEKISEEHLEMLNFLMIALMGEVGEAANIVKKINRGDFSLLDQKDYIEEEVVDIFIYVIKLAYQLDMDIEQAYINKMEKNTDRFKEYEQKR